MDSNYSALRKNSYVELSKSNFDGNGNLIALQKSHTKLLPPDEETLVNGVGRGGDDDCHDLDLELDEYPLVLNVGSEKGSGVSGAVFNLTTTIIGAGLMALPATMKVLGVVPGLVLIFLMGVISEMSIELLVRYAVLCEAKSYGEVVQCALGRTARIVSEICIIVNNAGVMVVYLIIMGDVMSGSVRHIGVFDQWLGNGVWDHRKILIMIILIVFLAPLCALNKIDSLSTTSAASVALAVVFVVVCFVVASIKLLEGTADPPRITPDFGSKRAILDLLVVIPIMSNAYVCHFNVQPIYNELEGRSPEKMNRVGRITILICVIVYASTAISGYLLFGADTESDVLTNFDKDLGVRFSTALNYIVRVGYILHLVLVFPVIHFSLRQSVDSLLFEGAAPLWESWKRSLALTAVLLGLVYFGSTMIPNIWTAFKFTGATTAVSLGFTFPALIALRLGDRIEGPKLGEKFLSWFMLVLSVIVSVVGIVGNIYSMSSKSE